MTLFLVLILLLLGCGPQGQRSACYTDRVIPASDLPGWRGDTAYSEVNSAWLATFHAEWKADLFRKGVVKWDQRFDCNRFAGHFAAVAQIEYFVQTFHSFTPGRALAVAELWYRRGGTSPHAIVCAYTERGTVYLEPQTGQELALTPAELSSIYLVKL